MKFNLLLVDDSPTVRAVMRKSLKMAGLEPAAVYEAGDGCEALETLHRQVVDLVITDLNMPNMRGDELIQRMAQDPQFKGIPVVVVSTEGSQTRLDHVVLPYAAGFIRKPFTPEQVRETLFKILEPIS